FNRHAQDAPEIFAGLQEVLFGGEAVNVEGVRRFLQRQLPCRLLHVYGPTEATTYTTWHGVEAVQDGAQTVPIGRPIANAQTYVLDERLEAVPRGVAGEL